jgi:gluconate 2-dehydrogenase gamma chain
VELLKAWEKDKKPFFETIRTATVRGMFSDPVYGGNAGQAGWKLLGYEHRPAWQPPFGTYDGEPSGGGG